MAAPTIVRTAWTDDDGSGTVGTVINNAEKTTVYDQIDDVVATLYSVAGGGTGRSTLTAHGVLLGNGTSAIGMTAVGATGTVFAGVTGADPAFTATPSVTSVSFGTASIGRDGSNNLALNSGGTIILLQIAGSTVARFDNGNAKFTYDSDNAMDVGASSTRWRSGYFGTSLSVGTTPATAGELRFGNASTITWRNSGNTANVAFAQYDGATRTWLMGGTDNGNPEAWSFQSTAGYTFAGDINISGGGALRATQTNADAIITGHGVGGIALGYNTGTGTLRYYGGTGSAVFTVTAAGNVAAATGFQTPQNQGYALTGSNTLTIAAADPGAGRTVTIPVPGTATANFVLMDGAVVGAAGGTLTAIQIGTNPATAGSVRLQSQGSIVSRNAVNGADFTLLKTDGSDGVYVASDGQNLVLGHGGGFIRLDADNTRIGVNSDVFMLRTGTKAIRFDADGGAGALNSFTVSGPFSATTYSVGATAGIDASITSAGLVGKTITVTKGIITGFA